ncbi:MAG: hypothetical protein KF865_13430 [Bdellovibrionaceae bacterium]|nr:hypothetical protein [Pseudobdellovibrionaceae bacterium]
MALNFKILRSRRHRWGLLALVALMLPACDGQVHLSDRKNKGLRGGDDVSTGSISGLTSAAQFGQRSNTNYRLSGTVGSTQSEVVLTGTGGWKLHGGAEGNAISR